MQRRDKTALKIAKYFEAMIKVDASDLHLKSGLPPHMRIHTKIRSLSAPALSNGQITAMVEELMTEQERAFFSEHGNVDLAYELPDSDRFRVNLYLQRGKAAVAVRRVTRDIPDFESLHLPPIIEKIANLRQGLILVSGPTGSGKSTTIASMIEYINQRRRCHILTLEDPIEYLYESKKALINQREIGLDVPDFQSALKYLVREDPDVVQVGDLRDHDTFHATMQVAETGHMVFATVHASGAAQTIGRMLDLFEVESRHRIRQLLCFNLAAIISQRLLLSVAKGVSRVPATEVLVMSPDVRKFISEDRDTELVDAMRSHELEGMHTFATNLCELIETGMVHPEAAYAVAPNPDELRMLVKGISTSRVGLRSDSRSLDFRAGPKE